MLVALVLARVIAEAGSPAPNLDDGDVLLIKRQHVQIGDACPPPGDAGVDGGTDDGGIDAGPDDAGTGGDADVPDAGCETIDGDAVTLMVQPRFSQVTTGARFAVLMVTPSRPILQASYSYVFQDLEDVTRPQVVEHVTEIQDESMGKSCPSDGCSFAAPQDDPSWNPPGLGDGGIGTSDGGYTVDTVGPYQIVRAQPATTAELETWLHDLNYLTLPADVAAVAPYIERGYTVVAVRVPLVTTMERDLPPIALTWAGSELRLPVALGTPAGGTARETTVYIAGPGRFELPGAAVPFAWRTNYGNEGFLTKNVVVLDSNGDPDEDPVAVSVPDVVVRDVTDVYTTKHVPVTDCGLDFGCGCGECNAQRTVRGDWLIVVGVVILTLRRKRRRR
ncbi:MAG: DUF2330 domain-containing protein [Polyangiales bacterium]